MKYKVTFVGRKNLAIGEKQIYEEIIESSDKGEVEILLHNNYEAIRVLSIERITE